MAHIRGRSTSRALVAAALVVVSSLAVRTAAGSVAGDSDPRSLLADGRYAEAEDAARARLQAAEDQGQAPAAVAAALDLLLEVMLENGSASSAEARFLADRAVSLASRCGGPGARVHTTSLVNRGRVLAGLGEWEAARHDLDAASALVAWQPDGGGLDAARIANHLGAALLRLRQPAAAGGIFSQTLTVLSEALGPSHPDTATSLHGLGCALVYLGRLDEAVRVLDQAMAVRVRTLGPTHPTVGSSAQALAMAHRRLGHHAVAKRLLRFAAQVAEQNAGPDHPSLGRPLNSLAIIARHEGDYPRARALLERVLRIWELNFGPEHADVAGILNNLALVNQHMGDYDAAREQLTRTLVIREQVFGPAHTEVAQSLTNLAVIDIEQGRWTEAEPLLRRALAIREAAVGPDSVSTAVILTNLGNVLRVTGQLAEARSTLERARAVFAAALGPDSLRVAEAEHNIGLTDLAAGAFAAARTALNRSEQIWTATFGPGHPRVAQARRALARLELLAGHHAAALELALSAETIGRRHLELTARALSEREALRYAATRPRGLDVALAAASATRGGTAPADLLDSVIQSRDVVLREMVARRRLIDLAAPGGGGPAEEVRTAAAELARLLVIGPGAGAEGAVRDQVDQARDRLDAAERRLARSSTAVERDRTRARITAAEVLAALPGDGALVSIVRHRDIVEPGAEEASTYGWSYTALVARGDSPVIRQLLLGSAQEIDAAVVHWRYAVSRPSEPDPAAAEAAYRGAASVLRHLVWDPVQPLLADVRQVFVVPDGELQLVAFASLPTPADRYLIDSGQVLHLLSHERDLVASAAPAAHGTRLLAIGAPDFDALHRGPGTDLPTSDPGAIAGVRGADGHCGSFSEVRFQPLPATATEVARVIDLWNSSGQPVGAVAAVPLIGSAASEPAFANLAPGSRVLHVATHGFFLSDQCAVAGGGPAGRGVGGLAPAAADSATGSGPLPNPLLLSGLALAGANRRDEASASSDDGILTAEEIAVLDLDGVAWAVLSACDTGVAEVTPETGVFGLRRAFRMAGARTVIMSLWAVADEPALQWMTELYRARLEDGLSTADSVRQASQAVLADRRSRGEPTHPFYWAGFVAVGDPR